jgi:hypothetical protein
MVLFVIPKPLTDGQKYRVFTEKSELQGADVAGVPAAGKPLNEGFCVMSSMGMSKLAVLVTLKISMVYLSE